MLIAEHPLHRSGRAELPHPAPVSGIDGYYRMRLSFTIMPNPVLCPGHGTLIRIPLDQPPSLHLLRSCLGRSFVRKLRRYYAAVRLPVVVHHRLSSSDFPTRPVLLPSFTGDNGLSRFSLNMFPHMLGVSDRAEPASHSPNFIALSSVAFEIRRDSRHSGFTPFRGSIPSLCVPLSTLGLRYCYRRPMTRSQTGSLRLACSGLSPPTYCRFLPAHLRRSAMSQRFMIISPLTGETPRSPPYYKHPTPYRYLETSFSMLIYHIQCAAAERVWTAGSVFSEISLRHTHRPATNS